MAKEHTIQVSYLIGPDIFLPSPPQVTIKLCLMVILEIKPGIFVPWAWKTFCITTKLPYPPVLHKVSRFSFAEVLFQIRLISGSLTMSHDYALRNHYGYRKTVFWLPNVPQWKPHLEHTHKLNLKQIIFSIIKLSFLTWKKNKKNKLEPVYIQTSWSSSKQHTALV